MTEDLEAHIKDILEILTEDNEKKVDSEKIKDELEKFLEYGVPIDQAKQTLIKKYGGTVSFDSTSSSERTLVEKLEPNQYNIKLLGRIISINPKDITVKGENRKIFYGLIGDESGTASFTSWKEIDVEKGDVVDVDNAYTREWQGAIQINFGDRTEINKTDKYKLPKTDIKPQKYNISDLKAGLRSVETTGRIVEINARDVEVDGKSKKVFSGIIADETGKSQFTSWHDWNLKKGDVIKIKGGYVKSWRNIPQLTFDQNSEVEKLDKKKIPKSVENLFQKIPIHRLVQKGGAVDVEVIGTIIEIRPGSGVINRCPECNRALYNGECSIHGNVDGKSDLRLKLVVDDGYGAVTTVLNKDFSEKILDMSFNDCKKLDSKDLDDIIQKKIFSKKILLMGNALGDEFGTTIIPKEIDIIDIDVEGESSKILDELEDLL